MRHVGSLRSGFDFSHLFSLPGSPRLLHDLPGGSFRRNRMAPLACFPPSHETVALCREIWEVGGMSSIGKLMKQAARMQQQMETVQAQLAARTVEATSGGGAVKVVAKCDGTIASIKIDPQAVNPADAQLLEDMVVTAANQALGQAKEISNTEMSKVTSGFSMPGLM